MEIELKNLLKEAADSIKASQADTISDHRRAYRVDLEKRIRKVLEEADDSNGPV